MLQKWGRDHSGTTSMKISLEDQGYEYDSEAILWGGGGNKNCIHDKAIPTHLKPRITLINQKLIFIFEQITFDHEC